MANHTFKDAGGTTRYRKATGAGTDPDPAVLHNIIDSGTVAATQSGTWNITNVSGTVSLPTGASTAANQSTIITSLQLLDDCIFADDAAFTFTSSKVAVVGQVRDDALATLTAVEGDAVPLRCDEKGALWVKTSDTTLVGGTVAISSLPSWTGATNIGKAEDAAHSSGDVGVPAMSVRQDTAAALSGTDGDYQPLITDASGRLHVNVGNTVTVGSHAVTNAGTFAVQESGAALTALQLIDDWDNAASDGASVSGDVAHDAADAGEPIKLGAKATASVLGGTPVAAADRVNLAAGTDGVLIVREGTSLEDIISERTTNTDGASTAMTGAFAATASQRIYLTDITLANSSASNITVDIRDGSAGSVLYTFPVPAGGGVTHRFGTPLRFSANTALAFDASAAATTLTISVVGFKSKV